MTARSSSLVCPSRRLSRTACTSVFAPPTTREEEVVRILALGATLVDDRREGPDKGWAVLADPEGNEFCVLTRQRA